MAEFSLMRCPVRRLAGLLLIAAAGTTGCERRVIWGTAAFATKVSQLEASDRCEKAISMLEEANARGDAKWYALLGEAYVRCMRKTGERAYGEKALQLLEEGTRIFPRSSRLVFIKSFANAQLNEWGLALRYCEDALKLAQENIAADRDGLHSSEDRKVAADAKANLESLRNGHP